MVVARNPIGSNIGGGVLGMEASIEPTHGPKATAKVYEEPRANKNL